MGQDVHDWAKGIRDVRGFGRGSSYGQGRSASCSEYALNEPRLSRILHGEDAARGNHELGIQLVDVPTKVRRYVAEPCASDVNTSSPSAQHSELTVIEGTVEL